MLAFDELADWPNWICWRSDPPLTPTGKRRKVPVSARDGRNASTVDPATWTTFDEAADWCEAHRELSGLGFVFTADDPYAGIDLDGCVDAETGTTAAWAQAIIDGLCSYTELSPSGTGVHVIVRAAVPAGGNRRGPIELYDRGRYFTVTGRPVGGTPPIIGARQAALDALHHEVFGEPECLVPPRRQGYDGAIEPDDEALLLRMFAASNGAAIRRLWDGDASQYADAEHPTGNPSSADMALCAHLAFWTGGDQARVDRLFRRSRLYRDKWDARRGETTYGQRTVDRVRDRQPRMRGAIAV